MVGSDPALNRKRMLRLKTKRDRLVPNSMHFQPSRAENFPDA